MRTRVYIQFYHHVTADNHSPDCSLYCHSRSFALQQAKIFNIFRAELDVLALLPTFDSHTLLDWDSMELRVRGRFLGDIIEAIATAVERLLRDWANKAVERFNKVRVHMHVHLCILCMCV